MLLFATCVMPVSLATLTSGWTAVVLIGLAGAAHQSWSATLYTTVSDMFPESAVARIVAAGTAAGSFSGILFPVLTGYVLDHCSHGYIVIFSFCSIAYLIAFGLNHLLAPEFVKISRFANEAE